jgi:hypothetical protein
LFVVLRTQYQANVESRYYLRVLVAVPPGPTEVEPNDEPAKATPLPLATQVAGILADTRDRDLFRCVVDRATLVRVRAAPPLGLDLALAVLDGQGKTTWEVNSGGARTAELIPALLVQPPGALIQLRAPARGDVTSVSSYQLRAWALDPRLTEVEPNDRREQATAWPAGQPGIDGYLHPAGDVDHFGLTPQQERLKIQLRPPSGLKLKLELLGPDGAPLGSRVVSGSGGALEAAVLPGASHWLRVTALEGGSAAETAYQLVWDVGAGENSD